MEIIIQDQLGLRRDRVKRDTAAARHGWPRQPKYLRTSVRGEDARTSAGRPRRRRAEDPRRGRGGSAARPRSCRGGSAARPRSCRGRSAAGPQRIHSEAAEDPRRGRGASTDDRQESPRRFPHRPHVIHRPIQDQILGRVLGRRVDIFLHRGTSVFWSQGHRVDAPQQDSVEGPIEREQRLESVADALALVARDPRRREDDAALAEYVVNFAEPFAFGI